MRKAWLAIPAMALCMAFAPIASATRGDHSSLTICSRWLTQQGWHGVQREFMKAAGMRYDAMMAKMKKMPADKSKMLMKGDMMTKDGSKMFIDEWKVYSGS